MKALKEYLILIFVSLILTSCGYWIKQFRVNKPKETIIVNNWELKPIISVISTQDISKEEMELNTDFVVYFKILHHNNDGSISNLFPISQLNNSVNDKEQILIDSLFIVYKTNCIRIKNKKNTNYAQSTISAKDFQKLMGYNYAPDNNDTVSSLGHIIIPNDVETIKFSFRVTIFNAENGEILESIYYKEIFNLEFYKRNQKVDELILDMMNV